MQHRSQQRSLVFYPACFTQSTDERFCFGERDRGHKALSGFFDDLSCEISRIAETHITRIKIFGTETGGLAECGTDDTSANICRTRIGECKLVSGEITFS